MKITTTGAPVFFDERRESGTCREENEQGYLTIKHVDRDIVRCESWNNSTDFYPSQIHPYWGDK
jgi:hypothetical protein